MEKGNFLLIFLGILFFASCSKEIEADFEADKTQITETQTVNFRDLSVGDVKYWEWTFEGGTPSSSTEPNPQGIRYDKVGSYMVKLKVSNDDGEDEIVKTGYINVTYRSVKLLLNGGYNFSTNTFETSEVFGEWASITDLWYTNHLGYNFLEGKYHLEHLGEGNLDTITYPYPITAWQNYWKPMPNHCYGLELWSTENKFIALKVIEVAQDSSYVVIEYKDL